LSLLWGAGRSPGQALHLLRHAAGDGDLPEVLRHTDEVQGRAGAGAGGSFRWTAKTHELLLFPEFKRLFHTGSFRMGSMTIGYPEISRGFCVGDPRVRSGCFALRHSCPPPCPERDPPDVGRPSANLSEMICFSTLWIRRVSLDSLVDAPAAGRV